MPSLRHNSAMLSSPRRPAITMRIFSSAEYCRRVARRISRIRFSASSESVSAFVLIARSFAVKMSSKSSLPQSLTSVQLVLTGNSQRREGAVDAHDASHGPFQPDGSAGSLCAVSLQFGTAADKRPAGLKVVRRGDDPTSRHDYRGGK